MVTVEPAKALFLFRSRNCLGGGQKTPSNEQVLAALLAAVYGKEKHGAKKRGGTLCETVERTVRALFLEVEAPSPALHGPVTPSLV